jgi:hypothetical protein
MVSTPRARIHQLQAPRAIFLGAECEPRDLQRKPPLHQKAAIGRFPSRFLARLNLQECNGELNRFMARFQFKSNLPQGMPLARQLGRYAGFCPSY